MGHPHELEDLGVIEVNGGCFMGTIPIELSPNISARISRARQDNGADGGGTWRLRVVELGPWESWWGGVKCEVCAC